jgi:hypothetical protein
VSGVLDGCLTQPLGAGKAGQQRLSLSGGLAMTLGQQPIARVGELITTGLLGMEACLPQPEQEPRSLQIRVWPEL